MKRGFIRALWGVYDHQGRRFYKRRQSQDDNIWLLKKNEKALPFTSYTFGEDNHKFLIDQGFNSVLIDPKPIIWDMEKEQFRHKLEVLKCGLQEFDEIIFMDWDCMAIRDLPKEMWNDLSEKEPIQAIMRMYHKRKATWRGSKDTRKIPEASWVYIRDKQIGDDLIDLWEKMGKPWSEELVVAKYIDNLMGGWKGNEEYWKRFEPTVFTWANTRVCSPTLVAQIPVFAHFAPKVVGKLIREIKKGNEMPQKVLQSFCDRHAYGQDK